MMLGSFRTKLYTPLLALSSKGFVSRHLSYMLAGLACFFVAPPLNTSTKPPSTLSLIGGGLLLVVGLLICGELLNLMLPLMRAAGQLPFSFWASTALLTVLYWRYTKGRAILLALASEPATNP